MRLLSLAHLTVIDAHPLELIDAAAAAGFDAVGLRIVPPLPTDSIVPVVGDVPLQRRIKARLAETGLQMLDVEAFWLMPDTDAAAFAPALDLAVEFGARYVLCVGNDPDAGRMATNLAALCEACHARGLRAMLEFIPYSQVVSLAAAYRLLSAVSPANAGILVDALHLSRSGGHPSDMERYDPALFSYMHICDASFTPPSTDGLRAEARGARMYPGEGGLWLRDFAAAFPSQTPAAVEAPSALHADLPPEGRARLANDACGKLFLS